MAAIHDDGEVGFEEGMLWLPSHVLDEACGTKICMKNRHQKVQNHKQMHHHQRYHKSSGEQKSQHSKFTSRSSYQRTKFANGGPGMQVMFLESGHRPGGTGVFLPQISGTNFQQSKRPACAPVLLPARVVQALNLNMHALGLQILPPQPQVQRYNPTCREKRSDQRYASKRCSSISQNLSSSPEIFLPKEWTY